MLFCVFDSRQISAAVIFCIYCHIVHIADTVCIAVCLFYVLLAPLLLLCLELFQFQKLLCYYF